MNKRTIWADLCIKTDAIKSAMEPAFHAIVPVQQELLPLETINCRKGVKSSIMTRISFCWRSCESSKHEQYTVYSVRCILCNVKKVAVEI